MIDCRIKSTYGLYKATETENSNGELVASWAKEKDIAGLLWKAGGGEQYQDERTRLVYSHGFMCFYDAAVTEQKRIVKGSDTYEIVRVKPLHGRDNIMSLELKRLA
jgi:hypothetical protein